MTAALFEDWFHRTFVPATRRHLRSRKIEPKAVLLVDNCAALTPNQLEIKGWKNYSHILTKEHNFYDPTYGHGCNCHNKT